MQGEYLAWYLIFVSLIGISGFYGADFASADDLKTVPVLDEDPGLFGGISYAFQLVAYFLAFQGLTVFGVPAIIGGLIGTVTFILLAYVGARLVRGGG